eukprot:TRINITY_DN2036_c0_g2_i1.p1 TRINITY_DN2036_c0_g2~~TRINITY_DN2036_c0_g2_i1.p1  ORF type:complete len:449 (-),score=121.61 TRINITY_DN2036_c0_g2_i1:7-1353(-)
MSAGDETRPLLINDVLNYDTPGSESSALLHASGDVKEVGKKKSTTLGAYVTFVNGFIGGGLLGMPYGFKNGGLIACAVGLIFLAFISNFTVRLLGYMKTEYRKKDLQSYSDIGRESFGKTGVTMVNVSIIASQFGYCCAYLVFIGDNISSLSFSPHWLSAWEVLLILLPIIIAFVFLRSMHYLSPTAILANIAVIAVVVIVLVAGFTKVGIKPLKNYEMINIANFATFYGIVAFGYTIHGLALEIHSSMRDPTKYDLVVNLSMGFVTVIYLLFGGLGYLFFGDKTSSEITKNLAALGIAVECDTIKLALSLVLIFAYPLQMFPVIQILERLIIPKNLGIARPWLDTLVRNVMRACLAALSLGMAKAIPYFGLFSALVGTFSNSFMAFIFPCIAYLKLFRHDEDKDKRPRWWMTAFCIFVILIGIIGMGVGSAMVIKELVHDIVNHISS